MKKLFLMLTLMILISSVYVIAVEDVGKGGEFGDDKLPSQSQPLSETGTQSEGPPDYEVVKEGEGPTKGPINLIGEGLGEEDIPNVDDEGNLIPDDSEGDVQYEKDKEVPKQPEPVITPGPGEYPDDGGILAQPGLPKEEPQDTGALPEFNTVGLLLAGILGAGAWAFVRRKRL